MKKSHVLLILLGLFFLAQDASAFWMWTPETNKWVNPKYSVKDTPKEQLDFAKGFYDSKQYPEAVRELKKLIKNYPKSRDAANAQYYIGRCYEDQGKLYSAFKEYQLVLDKYPFSEMSPEVIEREYKIGQKLMDNPNKGTILDAVAGEKYDIVKVFQTIIKNEPYGKYAAPSQYKIGLYLMGKGLTQEARDEFEKVINDYPESEWVKAAKYQIATADSKRSTKAQYDQKVTGSAVDEFKNFVKEYPDAELTQVAKDQIQELRDKEAENNFVVAEFYEKQKNYSAAKLYYEGIVTDYKDSKWAIKALRKVRDLGDKVDKVDKFDKIENHASKGKK
ncbi:MAG: outer membrane protein assembly factor BamD [Candidatus Omnitrophica bacterium]|nr:outer membrane protein assembly factor BamD [Candidatus Omnitrophota bacterium]